MSNEHLEKLKELLVNEVVLSNNKLLLLTGTFNYYIDRMKINLERHIDNSYIKDILEKKLEECGIFGDKEKDEELRDLKHDFLVNKLLLQNKEVSLLIEGLEHFIRHESKRGKAGISKKYLELKDYLEDILKEGSK